MTRQRRYNGVRIQTKPTAVPARSAIRARETATNSDGSTGSSNRRLDNSDGPMAERAAPTDEELLDFGSSEAQGCEEPAAATQGQHTGVAHAEEVQAAAMPAAAAPESTTATAARPELAVEAALHVAAAESSKQMAQQPNSAAQQRAAQHSSSAPSADPAAAAGSAGTDPAVQQLFEDLSGTLRIIDAKRTMRQSVQQEESDALQFLTRYLAQQRAAREELVSSLLSHNLLLHRHLSAHRDVAGACAQALDQLNPGAALMAQLQKALQDLLAEGEGDGSPGALQGYQQHLAEMLSQVPAGSAQQRVLYQLAVLSAARTAPCAELGKSLQQHANLAVTQQEQPLEGLDQLLETPAGSPYSHGSSRVMELKRQLCSTCGKPAEALQALSTAKQLLREVAEQVGVAEQQLQNRVSVSLRLGAQAVAVASAVTGSAAAKVGARPSAPTVQLRPPSAQQPVKQQQQKPANMPSAAPAADAARGTSESAAQQPLQVADKGSPAPVSKSSAKHAPSSQAVAVQRQATGSRSKVAAGAIQAGEQQTAQHLSSTAAAADRLSNLVTKQQSSGPSGTTAVPKQPRPSARAKSGAVCSSKSAAAVPKTTRPLLEPAVIPPIQLTGSSQMQQAENPSPAGRQAGEGKRPAQDDSSRPLKRPQRSGGPRSRSRSPSSQPERDRGCSREASRSYSYPKQQEHQQGRHYPRSPPPLDPGLLMRMLGGANTGHPHHGREGQQRREEQWHQAGWQQGLPQQFQHRGAGRHSGGRHGHSGRKQR